jgi:hypothetical protein
MTKDSIAQLSPPALHKPVVMKEAYVFSDGANKFTAPLGMNQCSLNEVTGTFSYVVWLLVAPSSESKSLQITSWRRQGFGCLMLIMLIKHSTIESLHFPEQPVC